MFQEGLQRIVRDISALGGITFAVLVFLFALAFSWFDVARRLFFCIVASFFIAGMIRFVYFKDRPEPKRYKTVLQRLDASSFPSLHAARAGFLVLVLAEKVRTRFALVLMVVLAMLVCYSRVVRRRHDYVDVLAGLVLGVSLGVASLAWL
ncbi:phosphatase PAP2 family protein [Candidatus Woesearchaeota archaeon]|nr:MAG: phosphatase PAP2 family protein [Candidatus Woesearchaeota archaeon]